MALLRRGPPWLSNTEDVSFRGMFLTALHFPGERQLVKLRVTIQALQRDLILHAVAVHWVGPQNPQGRPSGFGVEILGIDRAAREVWSNFVTLVRADPDPLKNDSDDGIRVLRPEIVRPSGIPPIVA